LDTSAISVLVWSKFYDSLSHVFLLNTLKFKISKLPITAGKIRFINQTVTEVKLIPSELVEYIPIRRILISPLSPTSSKAMEGMIAIARKTTLITQTIISTETCNNKI
jgi:hypothetical protein